MKRTPRPSTTRRQKHSVKMFISYSHKDQIWMKRLTVFLNGLEYDDRLANLSNFEYVHAWHDRELTIGNSWDSEIKQQLEEMDIFVPLVSAHFFASWYIQNEEMKRAHERHGMGEILVVPILLDPVNLREKCFFLHQLSALPETSRCWSNYRRVNDAYMPIDDGLCKAIVLALERKLEKTP